MNLKNIQTEIDAAFLYNKLATHEDDPVIANVFRQMSEIENSHAIAFAAKEKIAATNATVHPFTIKELLPILLITP